MKSDTITLSDKQKDAMIGEIHELNNQIHQYLRITPQTFTLMLGIPTTAMALAAVINFIDTESVQLYSYITFLIIPLILATLALYHLNVTSEAAVLAVQRDRLCLLVNKKLKKEIFTAPYVSKYLRYLLGTISLFILGLLVVAIVVGVGIYNAMYTPWLQLQIISSILSFAAILLGAIQIVTTKKKMKKVLSNLDKKRFRNTN